MSTPFDLLGLPPDAQERDVRRAYARLLKGMDTLAQPQAFMDLRTAFEQALVQVRLRAQWASAPAPDAEPQADAEVSEPPHSGDAGAVKSGPCDEASDSTQAQSVRSEHTAASASASKSAWTAEPAPVVAQHVLASAHWDFAPGDVAAATEQLRGLLADPALQGLETREAFERLLAQQLNASQLGIRRGALLLAADAVFDWRRAGARVEALEAMLDKWAALSTHGRQLLLALMGEPQAAVMKRLSIDLGKLALFERSNRDLLNWWLPAGQLERWQQAWWSLQWPMRCAIWLQLRSHQIQAVGRATALVLVLVLIGLFAFNLLAQRSRDHEAARFSQDCMPLLGAQSKSGWRDVPVEVLPALERCGLSAASNANDRAGYHQIMRIRQALLADAQGNRRPYASLPSSSLRLNLSDGRAFGFVRGEDGQHYCRSLLAFARGASWLRLGDAVAAEAVVGELAWCEATVGGLLKTDGQWAGAPNPLQLLGLDSGDSDALWILLRHTDAWPGVRGQSLSLEAVVRQATPAGFSWKLPAPMPVGR